MSDLYRLSDMQMAKLEPFFVSVRASGITSAL
jgi:hypothetical protein